MSNPVLPKFYNYTVEGVVDSSGNPKKFSIPSLSRNIYDEFDLEGLSYDASLTFYLNHPAYQHDDNWPLTFKFLGSENPVEIEMNLYHSPCFLSTPRKIVQESKATPVITKPVEKKTRKPRVKKEVDESSIAEEIVIGTEDIQELTHD